MELSNEEEIILVTLSFYESLRWEQIILDLDDHFLKTHEDFSKEDLEKVLASLVKKKLVKKNKGDEPSWIRLFPKKSLWQKIKSFLK